MHDAQELLNRTPEYTGEWERTHEHREWAHGGGTSPTHTADDVSEGRLTRADAVNTQPAGSALRQIAEAYGCPGLE